jgi:hypothetical protein
MSLNKTIGGTCILCRLQLFTFLLELNTNESLKEAAKEQAGLKRDQDVQIANLINYNIDIVSELQKKHLSSINFTGASVHMIVVI